MSNEKSELLELGGLWKNTSQTSGETYYSGYLGNLKLMIFKNKYQKTDKEPALRMYVTAKPKKEEGEAPPF